MFQMITMRLLTKALRSTPTATAHRDVDIVKYNRIATGLEGCEALRWNSYTKSTVKGSFL